MRWLTRLQWWIADVHRRWWRPRLTPAIAPPLLSIAAPASPPVDYSDLFDWQPPEFEPPPGPLAPGPLAPGPLAPDPAPLALAELRQLTAAELEHLYELERRKHDKFVVPERVRPKPPRRPRSRLAPDADIDEAEDDAAHPAAGPLPAVDGGLVPEHLVVEQHHDGGNVLYKESEFWGEFNFRDTILTQLERYFVYLRRMRRRDPDAYAFYRALGANLIPYPSTGAWHYGTPHDARDLKFTQAQLESWRQRELTPHFRAVRPAFGCVAHGTNPLIESHEQQVIPGRRETVWHPKFMYFVKYTRPPVDWEQAPRSGDVYRLVVWWDKPHMPEAKIKYGIPQEFGVWVSADGHQLRVLKRKLSHNRWAIPNDFKSWAHQHGVDVQLYLSRLFMDAVESAEQTDYSMVRVNVHKGSMTAVFGVNVQRLAYFFRDRDATLNEHGHVKRIFHMVRPHKRRGKDVGITFRGLREFDWAGYRVQLTVPGKHHAVLSEFTTGMHDFPAGKRTPHGWVSDPELGERLAAHVRGGSDIV